MAQLRTTFALGQHSLRCSPQLGGTDRGPNQPLPAVVGWESGPFYVLHRCVPETIALKAFFLCFPDLVSELLYEESVYAARLFPA